MSAAIAAAVDMNSSFFTGGPASSAGSEAQTTGSGS